MRCSWRNFAASCRDWFQIFKFSKVWKWSFSSFSQPDLFHKVLELQRSIDKQLKRRTNERRPDRALCRLQAWRVVRWMTRVTNHKRNVWISFSIIGTRKTDSWEIFLYRQKGKMRMRFALYTNRHRKIHTQTSKFSDDLYVIPVKPCRRSGANFKPC